MKLNKRFVALLALFVVCVLAFTLAACNDNTDKPGPNPNPGGDVDIDPEVESLEVTTAPLKVYYTPGQSFDPTGMVLVAKWNDGEDEELGRGEYTIAPEVFDEGDKYVTFTYEGVSLNYPVTVSNIEDVTVAGLEVNRDRIATICSAGYVDMSQLEVNAVYDEGGKPQKVIDYVLYDNGEKMTADNGTRYFFTEGKHTVTVSYGKKTADFDIDCPYTLVEAENHNGQGDFVDSKNYAEWKTDGNHEFNVCALGAWGYSSWGINVPSGGQAVNGIENGESIMFRVWSAEETDRMLKMSCASTVRVALNSYWGPDETADIQFNQVFELYVNGNKVDISDDVVVQGRVRCGKIEKYSLDIWVQLVDIATVHLVEGNNDIEFKSIGQKYVTTKGEHIGTSLTAGLSVDYIVFGDKPLDIEPAEENNFRVASVEIVKVDKRAMVKICGYVNGLAKNDLKVGVHCLFNGWRVVELDYTMTVDEHNIFTVYADITALNTDGESLFCMWRVADEQDENFDNDSKHIQVPSSGKAIVGDKMYSAGRPYNNFCGLKVETVEDISDGFKIASAEIMTVEGKAILQLKGTIRGYEAKDLKFAAHVLVNKWRYEVLSADTTVENGEFIANVDITSLNEISTTKGKGEYLFCMMLADEEPDDKLNGIKINSTGVAKVANVTYTAGTPYGNPCGMVVTIEEEQPVYAESIEITQAPTKTDYKVGETFDVSGMIVVANMSDGTQKTLTAEEYSVSPSVIAKGTTQVTISYQGKEAAVDITAEVVKSFGVTEATIKNDGDDKAVLEVKGELVEYTKDEIKFSILSMKGYKYSELPFEMTVDGESFVATMDITSYNTVGEYIFYMHLATESAGDNNRIETADTGKATVGNTVYTASKPYNFPCGMTVKQKGANVKSAVIKNDGDDKAVLEVKGELIGYTKDDVKMSVQVLIKPWHYEDLTFEITVNEDGTYTAVADITGLNAAGEYIFHMPLGGAKDGDNTNITVAATGSATVGNVTYTASTPYGNPCGMKVTVA